MVMESYNLKNKKTVNIVDEFMNPTIEEALKSLFNQWLKEVLPDIKAELKEEIMKTAEINNQQTLFTQTEMAKRQNVSVTTFRKWRKMGLEAEPNPTGKLLFDLSKVNSWRKENCRRKVI